MTAMTWPTIMVMMPIVTVMPAPVPAIMAVVAAPESNTENNGRGL